MGAEQAPDWLADYQRLTESCGVIDLENWTTIEIAGQDRVSFLHNMCTQDVRTLEVAAVREAFFTDVKGKIVAHGWILAKEQSHLFLTVPSLSEKILPHLDRYIIREDVQLADRSGEWRWQVVRGPRREQLCQDSDLCPEPAAPPIFGTDSWLVRNATLAEVPTSAWTSPAATALRLEAAMPLMGVDFDETHLPQEIDRDVQAISFQKGCYLGQETIARIDALGHVNKKLVLIRATHKEDQLTTGDQLQSNGVGVGEIKSVAWSPQLGTAVAFAFVKRGFNTPGTNLTSPSGTIEVLSKR